LMELAETKLLELTKHGYVSSWVGGFSAVDVRVWCLAKC
jgi:hypothetical protein